MAATPIGSATYDIAGRMSLMNLNTVNGNPQMAGDANNIDFQTTEEHNLQHFVFDGTQNSISDVPLHDRSLGGTLERIPSRGRDDLGFKIKSKIGGFKDSIGASLMSVPFLYLEGASKIPDPISIGYDTYDSGRRIVDEDYRDQKYKEEWGVRTEPC